MRNAHTTKIAAFLFCTLLLCSLNAWANNKPTKTSTERHIYTVIEFESTFMNRKKEKVMKTLGEPDTKWEHRGKKVWTYHKIIKDQEKLWNQNIMFDFGRVNYMWGSDSVREQ